MRLRILLSCVGLGGLSLFGCLQLFDSSQNAPSSAAVPANPAATMRPSPQALSPSPSPAVTVRNANPAENVRAIQPLRPVADFLAEMRLPSLWDVRKDLSTWLEGAKDGKVRSSIGFYLATENCQRFRSSSSESPRLVQLETSGDCSRIDASDYGRRAEFIRSAAQTGDPIAGLLFAKGAPAMVMFASSKAPNSPEISAIRFEAMSALEKAAENGVQEAYGLLASYYAFGTLGSYDLGRAYAYASVVAQSDADAQEILNGISTKMRPGELAAGASLLAKLQRNSTAVHQAASTRH